MAIEPENNCYDFRPEMGMIRPSPSQSHFFIRRHDGHGWIKYSRGAQRFEKTRGVLVDLPN